MTRPRCQTCGLVMIQAKSCTTEDDRLPYGQEYGNHRRRPHCRDCGTRLGGRHHFACAVAECIHGGQALTCPECGQIDLDEFLKGL
jgi:hypothetical protein